MQDFCLNGGNRKQNLWLEVMRMGDEGADLFEECVFFENGVAHKSNKVEFMCF